MYNNNKTLSDKMSGYVNELYSLDNQMDHRSSMINNRPKCQKLENLRIIKPFNEKQLLEFYNNALFKKTETFIHHFHEHFYTNISKNNNYYDLIMRLDKSIERFKDTQNDLNNFIQIIRKEEEKGWIKSEHHIHHSGRCFDGNFVEADYTYTQYQFDSNCVDTLNEYYYLLRERIVNEHLVHSYFYKYFLIRFEFIIYEALDIIKCLKKKSDQFQLYSSTISDDVTPLSTNYGVNDNFDNEMSKLPEFSDVQILKRRLFELISALFNYYRRCVNYSEQLKQNSYQAIVYIWTDFYKIATFYDRLFFLHQTLLCPTGSSRDFAPLIDPLNPLPLKANQYELGKEYVDFGVTSIFVILSPKILKENELNKQPLNKNNFTSNNSNDQWLFIDTDLEEELVHSSLSDLNEDDIITYLSRVPFSEILQFMSLIDNEMNNDNESDNNEVISSTETSMVRLFAFNTRLMLIFRNGLENFNCLRYKKLILYIASMIKQIIKTISDNWWLCKEKFSTNDQALLIRLQVEFDHFMLRSIMAILSTNRSGIWPLLAKIDFEGISEPMLWHILWVVYNNGCNEGQNDITSGLCPYMSANYWKDKFRNHAQWKFIFFEKLSLLSMEEAGGLIDFFYNMAISKSNNELMFDNSELLSNNTNADIHSEDFLQEILERLAEICLLKKIFNTSSYSRPAADKNNIDTNSTNPLVLTNQEFYSTKGVACLIKLVSNFKSLLVILLQFIEAVENETNLLVEPCFHLLTSIVIDDWKPKPKFLSILYKWLLEKPCEHILNRFARVLLTKIGWNQILLQNDQYLMVNVQQQQSFTIKLYQAIEKQFSSEINTKNNGHINYPIIGKEHLTNDKRLEMAQSSDPEHFGRWCWSMLLMLRLHPLDLISDELSWDEIVYGSEQSDAKYVKKRKHWTMLHMTKFNYDPEMIIVSKGIQQDNPFAIYVGSMISDLLFNGNSTIDLKKLTEFLEQLGKNGHFIPILQLIYHFFPFLFENESHLLSNNSLLNTILTLLQNGYDQELCSVILLQRKHFSNEKYCHKVSQAWTELLFECMNKCLNYKSTSWLSSFVSNFIPSASSSSISNVIVSILLRISTIFDRLSLELLLENDRTLKLYLQYLTRNLYGRMMNWKLTQIDSLFSSSWFSSWYFSDHSIDYLSDKNLIKSPWLTPFHLLLKFSLNSSTNEKPVYLIFISTEADIRRTYNIWNYLIIELNKKKISSTFFFNSEQIECEVKNACQMFEKAVIPVQLLPINLLSIYLLKLMPLTAQNSMKIQSCLHPLLPLLWRQFFSLYFLYTDSLSTIGNQLVDSTKLKLLNDCLSTLFDYHNQQWISINNQQSLTSSIGKELEDVNERQLTLPVSDSISALLFQDRLCKLYRAYRIWLKDNRFLQYADFDDEQFSKPEIQIKLLNSVVSSAKISVYLQNVETVWPEFDNVNSFFFLTYVNKAKLQHLAYEYVQFWMRLIKPFERSDILNEKLEKQCDNTETLLTQSSDNIGFVIDSSYAITKPIVDYSDNEFRQTIDYFLKLTCSINCNILFSDDDINFVKYAPYCKINSEEISDQDISLVLVIIHQIVDNIVEEARFVESQLQKYFNGNDDFVKNILPKLYHDVSREFIQQVNCNREFDYSSCTMPAAIKFEFVESILNNHIKQKYDRNRIEFDSIVNILFNDVPAPKIVASIYITQKLCYYLLRFFHGDPKSEMNQKKIKRLFETMSSWINLINVIEIKYHISEQLLDIFLNFLNKLSVQYMDEVNYFYLDTTMQRNVSLKVIQQFAPCLSPSKTSLSMFLEMYKLVGTRLNSSLSQQTIFVLLSKFDVSSWLQMSHSDNELRFELLSCIFQCFTFFGTNPNDELLVTYDLYRKHLQDVILYKFPMFMPHILNLMLEGMTNHVLAPVLWNTVLHTFGFYTKSISVIAKYQQSSNLLLSNNDNKKMANNIDAILKNPFQSPSAIDFDFITFDEDLRTYLSRQKLFTSHELFDILQIIIEFMNNKQQELNCEFLYQFRIYNIKYLQFLTFISYSWISSNLSSTPSDISLIWIPMFDNWKFWIYPKQNTKTIQWEHFCFTWQLFINSVQFMLDSFYDYQSQILSCLWQSFINFILQSHSVEQEDVEMFELKLLQLNNWAQFYPTLMDMKLIYESVVFERYSVERLNSYIISKLKWDRILLYSPLITVENSVEILENLTYAIISLIDQPFIAQVCFQSIPFALLPHENVKKILVTLLEVMKKRISIYMIDKTNKEKCSNQVTSEDTLLTVVMKLLKALVQLSDDDSNEYCLIINNNRTEVTEFQAQRSSNVINYAHCIGSFLSFICNQNTNHVIETPNSTRIFLKDAIDSLRPTIDSFTTEDRIAIFCELLQPLNEIENTSVRDKLATDFLTIFSYMTSPQMFGEIMFAIGKIIFSIKTSVYLLESLIENYFDLSGDLHYLGDNLEIVHLKSHLSSEQQKMEDGQDIEDFILESIRTRSCLLLLIYINKRLRHRTVPDICTRRYIYNIINQCANHFKFGNFLLQNPNFSIEAKICFFWTRLFDLITFDHSSIGDALNISIHHLSSLKTTPSISSKLSTASSIESPIFLSQTTSPSSNTSSPSSLTLPSLSGQSLSSNQIWFDIHNQDVFSAIEILMIICASLNNSVSESLNRGFFGIFRQQKSLSPSCLFLLQSLVLHGTCTILETFFVALDNCKKIEDQTIESKSLKSDDIIRKKLKIELDTLLCSAKSRLRSWKKNKSFQEFSSHIDTMLDLTKSVDMVNIFSNYNNLTALNTDGKEDNIDNDYMDHVIWDHLSLLFANNAEECSNVQLLNEENELTIESVTKIWLNNYIKLSEHQQKRFYKIQRWLLEFYNNYTYMKHFS